MGKQVASCPRHHYGKRDSYPVILDSAFQILLEYFKRLPFCVFSGVSAPQQFTVAYAVRQSNTQWAEGPSLGVGRWKPEASGIYPNSIPSQECPVSKANDELCTNAPTHLGSALKIDMNADANPALRLSMNWRFQRRVPGQVRRRNT